MRRTRGARHHGVAPIADVEHLRAALQTAIELEHATIPAYLCALYSLRPGRNVEVAQRIESVVMEEMLHMVQAANVLNAIGGSPRLTDPGFIPRYPTPLPHSDGRVIVSLRRFSPAALGTFLRIERPEPPGAPPRAERYDTIGQFYAAIELGLAELDRRGSLFTGDPARQVGGDQVYGMAGAVVPVHDVASAAAGLTHIVEQGEGIDHGIHDGDDAVGDSDVAHYFRFDEIRRGRRYRPSDTPRTGPTGPPLLVDYDAVWPMRPDPEPEDLPPGSAVRRHSDAFDRTYTALLGELERALTGQPHRMADAVGLMWSLRWQAESLMRMPVGSDGQTAGPAFRFLPATSNA